MYYGAPPSALGSALFEFLRPEDKRRTLQGCTETNNKVCQIFEKVGGAVKVENWKIF